ncbi:Smr/MutS family protein [Curvibacter sp. PAE-UM]|uniref:Smr/MutS family protein n=1 Tax=Curvibacter sp. PAE-UM TaxID=1714344 RepID=UPI00070B0B61|nr:Smr/MutS family protein [Curvibacter sp. PAE-UM]KRH99737.1 DNA mismatch repair protein MutS [Curvibacter sp. PAE-UM]
MVTVKSLADLKQVKKAIEMQAKLEAERKAEAAKRARQTTADKDLFQQAAGKVQPLQQPAKAQLKSAKPPPLPLQHQLDEQAALQETLSDEFDISTLLETDEHLSYRRPGIGTDVTRKLRRGDWAIQRQLDLHGLRTEDAREALGQFIREAHQQGIRCVRVVHGKGLGSPGKTPVLKGRVQSWLAQKKEVLAFVQARPAEGGAGAVVVLLQPSP